MNLNDIYILVFNALLYAGTFFLFQKNRKRFGIGSVILLLYSLVAVVGIDYYYHPYATFEEVKLFPFIYLYVVLIMVVYPILRVDESKITSIQEPKKILIDSFSWLVVVVTVIATIPLLTDFNETIGKVLSGASFVEDAYFDKLDLVDERGDGSFSIVGVLSTIFVNFSPMLFFYYISREKVNKLLTWGLGIAIILNLFIQISQSARGDLVTIALNIIFLYFFFLKSLDEQKRKFFRKLIILFTIILGIPFIIITIGRFGDKDSSQVDISNYFLERYVSESFLNFNSYGLNPGGSREGDRTATFFKQSLGFETADNYNKRLDKYYYMNMDESIFSTYVGEFTLDYGPYITFAFFLVMSVFFRTKLKKIDETCTFSQYILFYFLFNICVGIFLFPYSDVNGNLRIIMFIILYVVFQYDYKNQQKELNSVN